MEDPTNQYWALDEVYRAIKEGLLQWGGLTSYWRERGAFSTVAGTAFYDLATELPDLRSRAYTFDEITKEIQYHFLEPADGVAGAGMTDQFSIGQITSSIKRKRNEFDIDAPVTLSFGVFPLVVSPLGRADLDDSIDLIQRVAWIEAASGIINQLWRIDEWQAQSFNPIWPQTPQLPNSYSMSVTPPVSIQFVPPPLGSGSVHLVYSQTLDLAILAATSLQTPDEFVHAIKYAAMYEALSTSGPSYDPMRAKYCLERYNAIVDAAQQMRSVVRVQVNDVPVPLDTLQNMDAGRPFWQNRFGTPNYCGCTADILALSDVPSSVFGMTCDVVRSAPLPALTTDFIQMGREEIPYLIDYCRHVLSFKLGGVEFMSTLPLYDNFLRGAVQRNKILATKARFLTPLFGQPMKEQDIAPAA